jgi:hypothetical protein
MYGVSLCVITGVVEFMADRDKDLRLESGTSAGAMMCHICLPSSALSDSKDEVADDEPADSTKRYPAGGLYALAGIAWLDGFTVDAAAFGGCTTAGAGASSMSSSSSSSESLESFAVSASASVLLALLACGAVSSPSESESSSSDESSSSALRFTPLTFFDVSVLIAGRASPEELPSESELSESLLAGVAGFFAAVGGCAAGGGCDLVFAGFDTTGCDDALVLETLGLAANAFCFEFESFLDFVIVRVGCESPSLSESTMRSWLSALDFFFEASTALAMIASGPLGSLRC